MEARPLVSETYHAPTCQQSHIPIATPSHATSKFSKRTLLTSAQRTEVGSGSRDDIVIELEDNTAQWVAVGGDFEEAV